MTSLGKSQGEASQDLLGARILVIMPSIPVQGMERANLQIMKMMRERRADVLFITEQTYGEKVRREVERIGCSWTTASLTTSFEERLHLTKSSVEMAGVLRAWGRAAWNIDRIYREYRPTHIYVTNVLYFVYALPTLWRARQPVVLRLPNFSDANLSTIKQYIFDSMWHRCVEAFCDVIVCNSEYTFSRLASVGVKNGKARVIYNCVPERIPLQHSDAPKVNPQHFNILYLGRVTPDKGAKQLFEVAMRVLHERDDVDFYFVGEYEWLNPFAESLVQEVRARNLESRIYFTGEIEDVFGLLGECDLHVLPSMADSFPNVVLEAKSEGVPSVVFPSGGIGEAVTHLVDGYICREKSAQALYEGIQYFLDDPATLTAAGEAARRSLGRFSRERIAEEWAEVFKKA